MPARSPSAWTPDRLRRARQAALAAGGALGLVGVVALLASPPAAEVPPFELAVLDVPAVAEDPPPPSPAVPGAAAAVPRAAAEPSATPVTQTPPSPVASSAAAVPPPVSPPAGRPGPAPAPATSSAPVRSTPYDAGSFKVKFASADVVAALVGDRHLELVLEYPDGKRFLLPRELGESRRAFALDDADFARWTSSGRVSELVPDEALQERVGLRDATVRWLAVLDDELVGLVDAAAAEARLDPTRSVLLIGAGPSVSVALARR